MAIKLTRRGFMKGLGGAALLAGLPRTAVAAKKLVTVEVGITGMWAAGYGAAHVGIEKGFFAEEGINFVWKVIGVADMAAALSRGALPTGLPTIDINMVAIDKGAETKFVAGWMNRWPYHLVAKPEIKTFTGMKGKIVGHWEVAPGVPLATLRQLIADGGLPQDQYTVVASGNNFERWAALSAGKLDAAVLSEPVNYKAKALGYNLLGGFFDIPIAFVVVGAHGPWAEKNEEIMVGLLKAYIKADRFQRNPDNKKEVLDIYAKRTKIEREFVEIGYRENFFERQEIMAKDLAFDFAALQNTLDRAYALGNISAPKPPLSKFTNDRYLKKALKELS